ncbi:MAG TPA: hypothetical protein VIM11_01370 [Tepidisphaeraceae bacterium]|jgi:antitoxin ParD1/3/4
MSIRLKPETEKQIQERLGVSGFASADDVICAGLRLLDERSREHEEGLNEVRRKIAVGLEQLDRGESFDGDEAFAELLADLERDGKAA